MRSSAGDHVSGASTLHTDRLDLSPLHGTSFAKMTGSGNDFVFFDGRQVDFAFVTQPQVIRSICNRHNGIGADGVVVLEPLAETSAGKTAPGISGPQARIHYFNSDGTPADLCGNATLCSTALSVEWGLASATAMALETPAGRIASRVIDGVPEIDLQSVVEVEPVSQAPLGTGEERIGFAIAGIPHLVVLCADADAIDVAARGPILRWHAAGGPTGANVNWVSRRRDGTWRYRTFERGVEGETLACGTGAVATAVLLDTWGQDTSPIRIISSSGRALEVRLTRNGSGWMPTLRGEGRVVFRGQIESISD